MQLIDRAIDAFDAAAASGVEEHTYDLLDGTVLVRYVTADHRDRLHPALAHLETAPAPPDLTLHAWAGGVGRPAPPAPVDAEADHGWFGENGDRRVYWRADALEAFDLGTAEGWLWSAAADRLDLASASAPFRSILEWWARSRGIERVHGAAVATDAGGLLLGGVGGSGKSTTALVAARAGLDYAGDDVVFVDLDDQPRVLGAYNTAKIEGDPTERTPWLTDSLTRVGRRGHEKGLAHVHRVLPERCTAGFPLTAVACARVSDRPKTDVRPLSGGRALAMLAPSSIVHQAGDRRLSFAALAALVRAVPCYALDLGRDENDLVRVVRELTGETPSGERAS